ncbi:hypothetical protein HS1genome_0720 [Sulfodiicoccus acidiphilus]|uniref:Uncharacterized protein n=1 Tax=Sulfodiicoccus acidiphilus TaxID=1670455 RepID=A0A348B2C9_9CREN|nr:hypothetical protein [Sulfodiicoccus acidiphilus]BBD72331.1 hypothetical protein HS1genome_0720 [Sulfodiicoccus acidiphilus]GGT90219.1 hypothetical protein GCM10007116_05010 [Sulfodiicoccus acidiphilus]
MERELFLFRIPPSLDQENFILDKIISRFPDLGDPLSYHVVHRSRYDVMTIQFESCKVVVKFDDKGEALASIVYRRRRREGAMER